MKKILEVPKIKQFTKHDCGTACLAMIMQYHGINIDLKLLNKEVNFYKKGDLLPGLYPIDISRLARKYKFKSRIMYETASIDPIITEINKKSPLILLVPRHVYIAKGYDDVKGWIYINDSFYLKRIKISFNKLLNSYKKSYCPLEGIISIRK